MYNALARLDGFGAAQIFTTTTRSWRTSRVMRGTSVRAASATSRARCFQSGSHMGLTRRAPTGIYVNLFIGSNCHQRYRTRCCWHGRGIGAEDGLPVERQSRHHRKPGRSAENTSPCMCACSIARRANLHTHARSQRFDDRSTVNGAGRFRQTGMKNGYADHHARAAEAADRIDLELLMEIQVSEG